MAQNPSNLDYGFYDQSRGRGCRTSSRGRVSSGAKNSPTPDTHIPETEPTPSPTAPTQMSIEDFVGLPGRDRLTRLHPDYQGTDIWFEDSRNGISKSINRMLNGLLQHPYPKYNQMPMADKEIWFRQFTQEFTWDSHITATVRRCFNKKTSRMYSWKLNEWKEK